MSECGLTTRIFWTNLTRPRCWRPKKNGHPIKLSLTQTRGQWPKGTRRPRSHLATFLPSTSSIIQLHTHVKSGNPKKESQTWLPWLPWLPWPDWFRGSTRIVDSLAVEHAKSKEFLPPVVAGCWATSMVWDGMGWYGYERVRVNLETQFDHA